MLDLFFRIPPWVWIALIAHLSILGTVAYLILLERKVASWTQDRIGPNRVGPMGLLQPLADGLKFILKEDYKPGSVDKILFTVAPGVMIFVVIISIAVLPWGGVRRVNRAVDVSAAVAQQANKDPAALDTASAWRVTNRDSKEYAAAMKASENEYHGTRLGEPTLKVEAEETGPDGQMTKPAHVLANVSYEYPFQIAQLNIGVLFILAVLSLAVYGVVIGGWASNNKYSFLGGLRATAQMISYEIPLGLCVLCIVVMFGTLDLGDIVERQVHYWGPTGFKWIPAWNVFSQPITFLMFLVCIHAEANRAPFDLAEAEQELVGGYHTEYSAMRFALFFLAEYAGMITTSAVCVALFFGGWHVPWLDKIWPALSGGIDPAHPSATTSFWVCILRSVVFFSKTIFIIFVFMWTRWSLPRFRFDQLMMLAWRAMIPISLALLVMTALVVWQFGPTNWISSVAADPDSHRIPQIGSKMALILLGANLALLVVTMIVSRFLPAAPATNRRLRIIGSRYTRTPLPAGRGPTRPAATGIPAVGQLV